MFISPAKSSSKVSSFHYWGCLYLNHTLITKSAPYPNDSSDRLLLKLFSVQKFPTLHPRYQFLYKDKNSHHCHKYDASFKVTSFYILLLHAVSFIHSSVKQMYTYLLLLKRTLIPLPKTIMQDFLINHHTEQTSCHLANLFWL
jgi:hypothetical protein